MKKISVLTKVISPSNTKPYIVAFIGLCVLSSIFYMYAINKTVRNVVKLQATETRLSQITSAIGEMEFTYINQKNSITFEKATALGFAFAEPSRFISRKSNSVALAERVPNTR